MLNCEAHSSSSMSSSGTKVDIPTMSTMPSMRPRRSPPKATSASMDERSVTSPDHAIPSTSAATSPARSGSRSTQTVRAPQPASAVGGLASHALPGAQHQERATREVGEGGVGGDRGAVGAAHRRARYRPARGPPGGSAGRVEPVPLPRDDGLERRGEQQPGPGRPLVGSVARAAVKASGSSSRNTVVISVGRSPSAAAAAREEGKPSSRTHVTRPPRRAARGGRAPAGSPPTGRARAADPGRRRAPRPCSGCLAGAAGAPPRGRPAPEGGPTRSASRRSRPRGATTRGRACGPSRPPASPASSTPNGTPGRGR